MNIHEPELSEISPDWSLQDISYSIGFAEQPSFNLFFKKNTGFTPAEFRKNA